MRAILAILLCISGAVAHQDQEEKELFAFASPMIRPAALEAWIDSELDAAAPEGREVRDLYSRLCAEWLAASAELRAMKIDYDTGLEAYRANPTTESRAGRFSPELRNGMVAWKSQRLPIEDAFLDAVADVFAENPALSSWQRFVMDTRRRTTLPELDPYLYLPLPDLVAILREADIDPNQPEIAGVTEAYIGSLDTVIVTNRRRYYQLQLERSRMIEADWSETRERRNAIGEEQNALTRPLYDCTITFGELYLDTMPEPERSRFERAWIAVWYPELAAATPAQIALERLRVWASARSDHRLTLVDEIAAAYTRRMHDLDRAIMRVDPPAAHVTQLFDADEQAKNEAMWKTWHEDVKDLPYAVWMDERLALHIERLAIVTKTCGQLRAIFDEGELPPDIWFALESVVFEEQ